MGPGAALWCSLQSHHNEHDGVSNHQTHDCLLNRLIRRRSKKTSKLRVTGLCEGNPLVTGGFPHKEPDTPKMFPCDDVILLAGEWCRWRVVAATSHAHKYAERLDYITLEIKHVLWNSNSMNVFVLLSLILKWSVKISCGGLKKKLYR